MKDKHNIKESLETVKDIAEAIVQGRIDLHDGANQIAQICHDLNYPDDLLDMMHMAHLQEGHENLGYNKENLRKDIFEEARRLIEKLP